LHADARELFYGAQYNIRRFSLYTGVDFSEVKGKEHFKRSLGIAASGAHNALTFRTQRHPVHRHG
jgi:predicted ATPase with chaperone activity